MSTVAATSPGRILIVEDDLDVLEVLKLLLEDEGHAVVPAKLGSEALEAARAKPFDLIVMDVSMPEMSGIEVGLALRSEPATADIRIVLHTAVEERMVRERFVDYDLFVTKADDTDLLIAEVARLLAAPRVPRGSKAVEPTYSSEEVLRAQCALRSAMGIDGETFPERAFIGMLGGEIEQLRKVGKSGAEIGELISSAIGRPLSPAAVVLP
jgi:CheY-like chemotaxis protein